MEKGSESRVHFERLQELSMVLNSFAPIDSGPLMTCCKVLTKNWGEFKEHIPTYPIKLGCQPPHFLSVPYGRTSFLFSAAVRNSVSTVWHSADSVRMNMPTSTFSHSIYEGFQRYRKSDACLSAGTMGKPHPLLCAVFYHSRSLTKPNCICILPEVASGTQKSI